MLKNHKFLVDMAETQPNSTDIFEDNLLNTYYPKRPNHLESVCLYDFVANYDWYGKDKDGKHKYTKLNKPRIPNH